MAETSVLSRDEHVELLQGLVGERSSEGKRHVAAIELTHDFFTDRLRGKHRVRAQHPLTLAEDTESRLPFARRSWYHYDTIVLRSHFDGERSSPEPG